MEILFLCLLFLAAYPYLIYPIILFILSGVAGHTWQKGDIRPKISIIISAHNEEAVIEAKIQNSLALDYPKHLLEIIVSSDGSTDKTNEIVTGIRDARVVLREHERLGKTGCLNKVVPDARGEIVLFTDANSMFPPNLLEKLVRNFSDSRIGLVTGGTKYVSSRGGEDTTGVYSRLEKWTKHKESLVSSCVGADGAVFAIRKDLYLPLGGYDINDFVIPLNVIRQNKRAIMDPGVFCYEEASKNARNAYRRQVRITTRTLWAIRRNLEFMSFRKYRSFAFFLLSHKLLRMLVPFFAAGAFLANLWILAASPLYVFTFIAQCLFVAAGIAGLTGMLKDKISSICKFFLITFFAQMVGWFRMMLGIEDRIWSTQR